VGESNDGRFKKLPDRIEPAQQTVSVPASEDDSTTPPQPPAGVPDLVIATRVADAATMTGLLRRTAGRVALTVVVVAAGLVTVLAALNLRL
jgi:hypothetical protein